MNIVNRLKYSGIVIVSMWLIIGSTLANATLQGRLETFSGSGVFQAYYDTALNTTWLTNANLAASNNFGVSSINAAGTMVWDQAKSWISAMNTSSSGAGYLGVTTWRLPTLRPVDGSGTFNTTFNTWGQTDLAYNISAAGSDFEFTTASELAYMFYNNLGGVSNCELLDPTSRPTPDSADCSPETALTPGLPDPVAYFENLADASYWEDLELDATTAWFFGQTAGNQSFIDKNNFQFYAWAVASGDVGAVPIPSAVWLFGSGLLGLVGLGRRKRTVKV